MKEKVRKKIKMMKIKTRFPFLSKTYFSGFYYITTTSHTFAGNIVCDSALTFTPHPHYGAQYGGVLAPSPLCATPKISLL
jgi:hypothetical protein